MSIKLDSNDRFLSTRVMMGCARVVDRLALGDVLNFPLASERVLDIRGNTIPDRQNIVDVESGDSISIMQKRFTLMQPERFAELVNDAVADVPHKVSFAGTFDGRGKYMVGIELTGLSEFNIGTDKQTHIEIFGGSCDGGWSLFNKGLNYRPVCSNVFSRLYRGADSRARNTSSGESKFISIINRIDSIVKYREAYKQACESLACEKVTHGHAVEFIAGLIVPGPIKLVATRSRNIVGEIAHAFEAGDGNKGETRFDLLNGFTQHFSRNGANNSAGIIGSAIAGSGARAMSEAFESLCNESAYKETCKRGRLLLAAN